MDILCARHGNTFGPGDRVVWVGANEDVPLTAEGENQARRLAAALKNSGIEPKAVFCSSLQRAKKYASLVVDDLTLGAKPLIHPALTEIDYGDWSNLTNLEVESKLRQGEAMRHWNEKNVWPKNSHWGGSEEELRRVIAEFLHAIRKDFSPDAAILVVTSNGILRFVAAEALGAQAVRDPHFPFKMATGNVGKIRVESGIMSIAYWNEIPGTRPL